MPAYSSDPISSSLFTNCFRLAGGFGLIDFGGYFPETSCFLPFFKENLLFLFFVHAGVQICSNFFMLNYLELHYRPKLLTPLPHLFRVNTPRLSLGNLELL